MHHDKGRGLASATGIDCEFTTGWDMLDRMSAAMMEAARDEAEDSTFNGRTPDWEDSKACSMANGMWKAMGLNMDQRAACDELLRMVYETA